MRQSLRDFLAEQNSVIRELGSFGGRMGRREIAINAFFFAVVVGCFVWSLAARDEFSQRLFLELGILLISAKLAYFLHRLAKVAHFQFWALVALEAKLDIITDLGRDLQKQAAGKDDDDEETISG